MVTTSQTDYSIYLDFDRTSKRPERVFQSMSKLTLGMKSFDSLLASSINATIESYVVLNEIQGGSILSSFGSILRNIDDDDLRDLNTKRIVGKFLLLAKHKVLDIIDQKENLKSTQDISTILTSIEHLKNELGIQDSLNSRPISHKNILLVLQEISASLSTLEPADQVDMISKNHKTHFNKKFTLSDDDIESLLTERSETKRKLLPLKVKKPDYLGKSKWIFKSNYGQMEVKIKDKKWLHDFQNAKEILLPGDSINALIETSITYDYQGNELTIMHSLIEVIDIIKGYQSVQKKLPF